MTKNICKSTRCFIGKQEKSVKNYRTFLFFTVWLWAETDGEEWDEIVEDDLKASRFLFVVTFLVMAQLTTPKGVWTFQKHNCFFCPDKEFHSTNRTLYYLS